MTPASWLIWVAVKRGSRLRHACPDDRVGRPRLSPNRTFCHKETKYMVMFTILPDQVEVEVTCPQCRDCGLAVHAARMLAESKHD